MLYCHVYDPSSTSIELTGFSGKIRRVSELGAEFGGSIMLMPSDSGVTIPIGEGPDRGPAFVGLPRVIAVEVDGPYKVVAPPIRQAANGSLDLKAIEATLRGGLNYEAEKECIGFWTNQADTVEWEFEAVRGEVKVEIELAAPDDSAGAEFEILVSGQTLRGKVPSTGSWSKFVKVDLGKISIVAPGKTKLVVKPLSKPGVGVMNLRTVRFRA